MDVEIPFEHRQTAHCESGVISALLCHQHLPISEPLAFGISGALTFAYVPFVKFGGMPLIAYRMPPKWVIRGLTKRLGIQMAYETFRDADQGMRALDDHLAQGRVVGMQSAVYWLDYFPPDMRFHFNGHNLVVYGKRGGDYLISDPVLGAPVTCKAESLKQSRFARGVLAPKGLLYYPTSVPPTPDFAAAIRKAIRWSTGMMLHSPLPFVGIRGIRYVANKVRQLRRTDPNHGRRFIGHMVRMQEEIGTGGAGFRFLYASFLQEASRIVGNDALPELAARLTAAGDEWRNFSLAAAKMCKERLELNFDALAEQLLYCADLEAEVYRKLRAEF